MPDTICRLRTHLVVEVIEIEATIDDVTSPLVCGDSAFLDGGDSGSTAGPLSNFTWTTMDGNFLLDIGPTAQVNSGGTYFLEVSDGLCTATDSIIVSSVDTFFTLIDLAPLLCADDSLSFTIRDSVGIPGQVIDFDITDVAGPLGTIIDVDTDLNLITCLLYTSPSPRDS